MSIFKKKIISCVFEKNVVPLHAKLFVVMEKHIFLSYGHDEYKELAERLKRDLENAGYEVWIDSEKIKGTADWAVEIEHGISCSDWLVLLMTSHSVRRPDGVCLDEVSYARSLGKQIAPIMIQNVHPPLCIARIQWIDMMQCFHPDTHNLCENEYRKKKDELLAILQGLKELEHEGGQQLLRTALLPLDNDVYAQQLRHNFYGREYLIRHYLKWYESGETVLWLKGKAGIGKTAFVAELASRRNEIKAVYFCKYNDNERSNPKRAIMSIAYYLSTQLDEYRNNLLELDLSHLQEKNARRLFEYLIIDPLNKITYNGEPLVCVIDALDEATIQSRNELVDVISGCIEQLPKWVKWVVTSRDDLFLRRYLSKFRTIDMDNVNIAENIADIRGFLNSVLTPKLQHHPNRDAIINTLVENSEGVFLYAKMLSEDIVHERINIEETSSFPCGLSGVYYNYFHRIFDQSEYDYKKNVCPILEIICTMSQPLSKDEIADILDVDEYELDEIIELMFEMFPVKDGLILPIHKSLVDWLLDSAKSGEYRVSARRGHQKISSYFENHIHKEYAIRYLVVHLLKARAYVEASKWLMAESYIMDRITLDGLDTAIRTIIHEIGILAEEDKDAAKNVLTSSVFINLLSEHRKYLYNSGLYFELKKYGLDDILDGIDYTKWPIPAQISLAYYFYITESYDLAISEGTRLLAAQSGDFLMQQELHNMVGLSYRKSVDFEHANNHFNEVLKYEKDVPSLYESSGALINIGKLKYHTLDWSSAEEYNQRAVNYLQIELQKEKDNDRKTTINLFLAEYYRLCAECYLWHADFMHAKQELDMAEEIYAKAKTKDRYYVRFCYTRLFYSILCEADSIDIAEAKELEAMADSMYDKAQIHFYTALYYCMCKKYELALMHGEQSAQLYHQINAEMELREIKALYDSAKWEYPQTITSVKQEKAEIKVWGSYVELYIKNQIYNNQR